MIEKITILISYKPDTTEEEKNDIANDVLDIVDEKMLDQFFDSSDSNLFDQVWDACFDDYQILMSGNNRRVNIIMDFDESECGSKNVDQNDIDLFVNSLYEFVREYDFIGRTSSKIEQIVVSK